MIRSLRVGLALAAAFLFAATTPPALAWAAQAAPASADLGPGQWPQAASDLAADPDIRFGVLPNGMRYAVRKQSVPPHQAALRLWIDAGSLMETDAQQGLAHFLEHMAFNGSEAVPEGEMIKILERLGLAFGADTNASTGFEETIYKLDLPRTDAETVDTSLMLLREAAGNLAIEEAAVDRERGVVVSEERSRDTPSYRIFKERLEFLLPGQRLPRRLPIGKVEVLRTAPASELKDFYRRYYRPERAVLVAVGDFDPAVMEAKIRARFGDWTGEGPAGVDAEAGPIRPRGTEARLVVEPGAPLTLQVAWVQPPDLSRDTVASRRRDLVEHLGFAVLNRRLSALARSAEPPFLGAAAFRSEQADAAEVVMVNVAAEPDRWREALQAAEREQRRIVRYGVRQDELDREIAEIRAALRAAVAGAATRRQSDLANEIVASLSDDRVVTSPAQEQALFEAVVQDLQAEAVSAALKDAFRGEGPLIFMATPRPVEDGEQALLAVFEASRATAVSPPAAPAQIAWPYESFGPPGEVAEVRQVEDLETTFVRFENGVRLPVKPTPFRDDEVLVRVNVGRGLLDLPANTQSMAWASGAFIEGGLAQITKEGMERVLASKVYGARFGIDDDAFVLTGSTRTGDLDTQLQVLAAYVAEPGWRPEAFQRLKGAGRTFHNQYEATPGGVLARDLPALIRGGDERWAFPSREEIATAELEALKAQIAPHLAAGAVEVVIVGDVTVEQAVAAVARTFGALPPRPQPDPVGPAQKQIAFASVGGDPVALAHEGRADQALAMVAWPTTDYWTDPQRARETAVMSEVLRLRLLEELRETQGATYSPFVGATHSLVWPDWGFVSARVEMPPEKLDRFFEDVRRIAADMAAKGVTADELARAKAPRIERLERARVTNGFWLSELSGAQADPRRLETVREAIPGTKAVTADDVQQAAERWLREDRAFRLVVKPATS